MTQKQSKLDKAIEQNGLTQQEVLAMIKSGKAQKNALPPYHLGGRRHKILLISDTHCGHKCYDPQAMDLAAKVGKDCDYALHVGDIVEGHYEARRPGHVLELTHIGGTAQAKYAAEELNKLTIPLFFISGNHCATFTKLAGFDIGERLEELVDDSKYLGTQHGSVEFAYGRKIQLIHPDGGISYALSYKPQKIVESFEGGTKPDILVVGNYHKGGFFQYRNVETILAGCLEHQTPFMKNLGIAAHVGFWTLDFTVGKHGINKFTPTWYPIMR